MTVLEEAFASIDSTIEQLARQAKNLTAAVRRAGDSAKEGDLGRLSQAVESAKTAVGALQQLLETAEKSAGAVVSELDRDPGVLRNEFEAACKERGIKLQQTDNPNNLVAFPAVVSFSPGQVIINRKAQRGKRPSKLVDHLERARQKPTGDTRRILSTFFKAAKYLHRAATGDRNPGEVTCTAAELYEILSLNNPAYDRLTFVYELYLLDRNRVNEVDGYQLELSGSTGSRTGKAFRIYDEQGHPHVYYALRFTRLNRAER